MKTINTGYINYIKKLLHDIKKLILLAGKKNCLQILKTALYIDILYIYIHYVYIPSKMN